MTKKIFLLIILFITSIVSAQLTGSYYNPKDDQFRLLGLKRAKEQYESAKSEFDRQKDLMSKNLISLREFENAKNVFTDAEVNYHQALLAVLFEQQYVSVVNAVKYQQENGQKHVRLTLANSSGGSGEFKKLLNIDDKLFNSLQPDVINNVYVSLLNNENAIISQPYEAKINALRFGKPVQLDFTLLQDLDEVTVNLIYGNGTQRAPKIYLQKDQSVNKVIFQSEQFSQVVELGGSATFNMTLELFSGLNNTYKLDVINLPKEINRYFVDPSTSARLSQFKFTESSQTRRAGLQVYLPDRPTQDVLMDRPISFFAVAVPYDKLKEFTNLKNEDVTPELLDELEIGYLKLEIVPKGIGELTVKAPQLFFSELAGKTIEVPFDILNEGSRRLDNVEFEINLPLNWTRTIIPEVVSTLDIREEKRVILQIHIPEDATVGKYEIRLRTNSLSDDQLVRAEDKSITVEVREEANIFATIVVVILILALVAGIVIFGIKLSKK